MATFKTFREMGIAQRLFKKWNPGTRIIPSKNAKNDEKCQMRIDAGELVDGRFLQVNLQVNSEASAQVLKDWKRKNGTHAKLASGQIDTQAADPEAEVDRLIEDLTDKAKEKL